MTETSEEKRTIAKSEGGRIKIALAFPNTYYLGMSNLGFQVIYRILNLSGDIRCDRFFMPDAKTLQHLKITGKPLTGIETNLPLSSFHVVAFSLSFENDFLNILSMLSLAKIPISQNQRKASHPLIIGGGVSVMLNPEPLAEIFDMFIIGEAEEVIEEFLDIIKLENRGKVWEKPPMPRFADIKGVYVPSAYKIKYNARGLPQASSPRKGFPEKIISRKVKNINSFSASSCISTPNTEFSDMTLIEAVRGCPRRCRFCAVGSIYKPVRFREKINLINEIKPFLKNNSRIGILGSAVSDHPELTGLIEEINSRGGVVSISSLRADSLTDEIVLLLKESGHKTFTIAPEAGLERLRKVIGKKLTDEEIFKAVEVLSRCKVQNIKLYFMIGLPGENEEDINAIIKMAKEIKHVYYKEAKCEKWLNHITLSITPFVPKPFTAFQWHPYEQVKSLKQKIKIILNGLKKEKKVAVNYDLPKWGYVQTLLSRGDRRAGQFLLKAFEMNGSWTQAFRETIINPDFYVYRKRNFDEIFPWDFIDHGINKKTLWDEYLKALS